MKLHNVLLPALLLAVAVLALHIEALREHLYWHNPWFHIGIHFLTGFVLALTASFVLVRLRPTASTNLWRHIRSVLPIVFLFAVAWEIFEYTNGFIYISGVSYAVDTTLDIFTGLMGGLVGVLYATLFVEK